MGLKVLLDTTRRSGGGPTAGVSRRPHALPLSIFETLLLQSRFAGMSVSIAHARLAGTLAGEHRDPFDRVLIAQARLESAMLITGDAIFRRFRIPVVWRS
jgi:PIN domain nuclease of toxin-antitoxin system